MMSDGTDSVTLTEAAANRIRILQKGEGDTSLCLRLAISGGGCSGFSYKFNLDKDIQPDDHRFEAYGVGLLVDAVSLPMLAGSTVDFVSDLVGSAFVVRNPNAASTCGCGSSFSV